MTPIQEVFQTQCVVLLFWAGLIAICHAWLPDQTSKISNPKLVHSISFTGNATFPDYFIVLHQDENSIIIGGRNTVYNLSIFDFNERKDNQIEWQSSDAHSQLCSLKGKTDDDCQNYIRIFFHTEQGELMICGTNSYKPLCRTYSLKEGKYIVKKEVEGIGVCPYNPEQNSTSVYYNGQLFSATVADFSGGDPLIYREPQRTEIFDLKQLNAPNFVSSLSYDDFIFFFYRETAVEYMNCGKVIYSRVARICKHDKGGPHQSRLRWTSFVKARLNCSIPGEYPFYFDEIQSTSEVVAGRYDVDGGKIKRIVYGVLTTPTNAIGGSAICAYDMDDIVRVFQGSFKQQESINSNWLPVPDNQVPEPRPGQCVKDSRILPDKNMNFIKTHSLLEDAVPALFGKPLLVRVSLQYRFTTIAVDQQVKTINNQYLDVLYIGTDDGKVLKAVNIPNGDSAKAIVISENTVLPHGAAVKQLKIAPGHGKIVVVGKDEVRLATLNHCKSMARCSDCVGLQDPHCAWDAKQNLCVSIDAVTTYRFLIQDVARGDGNKCWSPQSDKKTVINADNTVVEAEITVNSIDNSDLNSPGPVITPGDPDLDCDPENDNSITGCAVRQQLVNYKAATLHIVVVAVSIFALAVGFVGGYCFSRKYHSASQYPPAPFTEQHNHLERLGPAQTRLTPKLNKTVNLVINVPISTPPPKKDNLDMGKDLNISSDGTLQKIKKTYI